MKNSGKQSCLRALSQCLPSIGCLFHQIWQTNRFKSPVLVIRLPVHENLLTILELYAGCCQEGAYHSPCNLWTKYLSCLATTRLPFALSSKPADKMGFACRLVPRRCSSQPLPRVMTSQHTCVESTSRTTSTQMTSSQTPPAQPTALPPSSR